MVCCLGLCMVVVGDGLMCVRLEWVYLFVCFVGM